MVPTVHLKKSLIFFTIGLNLFLWPSLVWSADKQEKAIEEEILQAEEPALEPESNAQTQEPPPVAEVPQESQAPVPSPQGVPATKPTVTQEVSRIPHPGAAKGLIRINSDGSYQYQVKVQPKNRSASLRFAAMSPPQATSSTSRVRFQDMYGSNQIPVALFDYEWQPFKNFGILGVQAEGGFAAVRGSGHFASGVSAQEKYQMFIFPVSALLVYRLEYGRRQWIVPYVNGGATYYGLIENRDDNKSLKFAGSPAVGGGGGVHISITRWDPQGTFIINRDYGVADMWFTLEARYMQGLKKDIDFTNSSLSAGITVDF